MIADNVRKVKEFVPKGVVVVAVAKNRSLDEVKAAVAAGLDNIGENRVQEALLKYGPFRPESLHMVGHLQTNKVKDAVKLFDLIQSVDSIHLGREIDKQAKNLNKVQEILFEVKTSSEAAKFGFPPDTVEQAVKELACLKNIKLCGLMTIAPLTDDPEQARPYFRQLRELRDKIIKLPITDYQLPILSMGMSDDFKVAIEEGATMIRLGRAIFEG